MGDFQELEAVIGSLKIQLGIKARLFNRMTHLLFTSVLL